MKRPAALLLAALFAVQGQAAPQVFAQALFQGKAMLSINGVSEMLAEGQTGSFGVRLIKATSSYAEVEVDGNVRRVGLGGGVHTNFEAAEPRLVSIAVDASGAYSIAGAINGSGVDFIVDTGAQVVAMNAQMARRIGIDYSSGDTGLVTTASGQVKGYAVSLDRVSVGEIELRNIDAVVIEGGYPKVVLLGMSFLSQVEMRESGGVMELRSAR